MLTHSRYECICVCGGKTHYRESANEVFICICGRPSYIDGVGLSERELLAILDGLDVTRDRVAKAIELRRDRLVAR